jgi:nucleoside-diphosphate-sugar epimerase
MPSESNDLSFFVTGGSGVIGRNVLAFLCASNVKCRVLEHRSTLPDEEFEEVERVKGDILDFQDSWIQDIDAVIHLAAQTRPTRNQANMRRCNVEGTKQIVQALKRANRPIRLVFTSSIAVLGPSRNDVPLSNHNLPAPITDYGRSKLEAERLALTYKHAIVVRFPMVIGADDRASGMFSKFAAGRIFPVTPGRFSALDMRDAVRLLFHVANDSGCDGKTFTVSDGKIYAWLDVARIFEKRQARSVFKPRIPRILLQPFLFGLAGNADGAVYLKYDWFCDPNFPAGFVNQHSAFDSIL